MESTDLTPTNNNRFPALLSECGLFCTHSGKFYALFTNGNWYQLPGDASQHYGLKLDSFISKHLKSLSDGNADLSRYRDAYGKFNILPQECLKDLGLN